MKEMFKNFLKGYSKSLEILPNFQQNNQYNDWVSIGYDLKNSFTKYKAKNEKQTIYKRKR